MKETKFDTKVA